MDKLVQACKRNEQEAERRRYAAKVNADDVFRSRFRAIYGGGDAKPDSSADAPPQKPPKNRNRNGKK